MKQSRGDTTCAIAGHISFINIAAKKWIAIIEKTGTKIIFIDATVPAIEFEDVLF